MKLQSGAAFSDYKVGQNNYKKGQLKNYKVGQKNHKVGHNRRSFFNLIPYICLSLFKQCPIKSMGASQQTSAHGINNLNELLRKYFLLFKLIAEQTARSTFIQLTFIQSSRQLLHNFSFINEILLKCIFHSIVLNQPTVHYTS